LVSSSYVLIVLTIKLNCFLPNIQHPLKSLHYNQLLASFLHMVSCFPHMLVSIHGCYGFEFLDIDLCDDWAFIFNDFLFFSIDYNKNSTSSVNFDFSFPFFYVLILFSSRDHILKLLVKCSFKFNIVFASQLEDKIFVGLSSGVKKNSSYFPFSIGPLRMIPLLVYCNCSFHDFSSFFFLMSQPLVDPYNVTHLSIKFIMFNHYSRKTINVIKTWLPFSSWNQYQYPFIGTCILVSWFRSLMLEPILFPTNQPSRSEFSTLNCFFFQSPLNNNSYVSTCFGCVMKISCS